MPVNHYDTLLQESTLLPRTLRISDCQSDKEAKRAGPFKDDFILHVNPTGKFVIGGPHGDTGLTGRKIIVDTYGTEHNGMTDGEIASGIRKNFDLRPAAIIERFGLKNPIYEPTAAYGHFGRDPFRKEVELIRDGKTVKREIQFFGWECLDAVDYCRENF